MKKIQVLLDDERYLDVYVPSEFSNKEIQLHLTQLFDDTWQHWSTYK